MVKPRGDRGMALIDLGSWRSGCLYNCLLKLLYYLRNILS